MAKSRWMAASARNCADVDVAERARRHGAHRAVGAAAHDVGLHPPLVGVGGAQLHRHRSRQVLDDAVDRHPGRRVAVLDDLRRNATRASRSRGGAGAP